MFSVGQRESPSGTRFIMFAVYILGLTVQAQAQGSDHLMSMMTYMGDTLPTKMKVVIDDELEMFKTEMTSLVNEKCNAPIEGESVSNVEINESQLNKFENIISNLFENKIVNMFSDRANEVIQLKVIEHIDERISNLIDGKLKVIIEDKIEHTINLKLPPILDKFSEVLDQKLNNINNEMPNVLETKILSKIDEKLSDINLENLQENVNDMKDLQNEMPNILEKKVLSKIDERFSHLNLENLQTDINDILDYLDELERKSQLIEQGVEDNGGRDSSNLIATMDKIDSLQKNINGSFTNLASNLVQMDETYQEIINETSKMMLAMNDYEIRNDEMSIMLNVSLSSMESDISKMDASLISKANQTSLDILENELNNVLNTKANKTELGMLENSIAEETNRFKRDIEDTTNTLTNKVETLENKLGLSINEKSNQNDLDALRYKLENVESSLIDKVEITRFERFESNVESKINQKVDISVLTNMEAKINGKADKSALTNIEAKINGKADKGALTDMEAKINKKVEKDIQWILDGTRLSVGSEEFLVVTSQELSWTSARSFCKQRGGDLASPSDVRALADRMLAVGLPIGFGVNYWVGGQRSGGRWSWLDGRRITTGWRTGAPDGDGDCVGLWPPASGDTLYDGPCSYSLYFICER